MAGFPQYDDCDGVGLAELMRRGEVSPAEVLSEAMRRIDHLNPEIGAVVRTRYERARAEATAAEGELAGVPFLLKDLHADLAGEITTSGSRFTADYHAAEDSEIARRFRRAGLVFVGRTNTPELGVLPVTENRLYGTTKNPWDLSRTPGGSSGGAAAAVAAGLVPMAHASDGGGSIRIPAACAGLFGLKPTRGRTPTGPDAPDRWSGFSQEHVVSRSVRDSAAALDAVAGPEPGGTDVPPDPARPFSEEIARGAGRLRIAMMTEPVMPSDVEFDCLRAARDAAELCASLGHEVEEIRPGFDPQEIAEAFLTVVAAYCAAGIGEAERALGRRAGSDDLETQTWLAVHLGRQLRAADLVAARRRLFAASRRFAEAYDSYDAILSPALGRAAVPHGALAPSRGEDALQRAIVRARLGPALRIPGVAARAAARLFTVAAYTPLANFSGRPSMSVPLWWNGDGLPIGSLFTGRHGDEATLFRLAAQLEEARPWFHRRPPVRAGA